MKFKFFIILICIVMNPFYSQTPPTPPTPPSVNGGAGKSITYSEAETDTSYAFSCAFNKVHFKEIKEIVAQGFKDFKGDCLKETFHLKNKQFKVKIKLRETELEMTYKSRPLQGNERLDIKKVVLNGYFI